MNPTSSRTLGSNTDSASLMGNDPSSPSAASADVTSGGLLRPAGLPLADSTEAFQPPRTFQGISQGTFILLLVAAIAAGAIYIMRITQGTLTSNAEVAVFEAKIEQALARLGGLTVNATATAESSLPSDTESIVAMFTDDVTRRQIPKSQLKSNPFIPKTTSMASVETSTNSGLAIPSAPVPARASQTDVNKLKLEAVVQGRVPVAIINGSLYQIGQRIGAFRIRSIQGMEVELETAGETYVLKIDRTLTRERSH